MTSVAVHSTQAEDIPWYGSVGSEHSEEGLQKSQTASEASEMEAEESEISAADCARRKRPWISLSEVTNKKLLRGQSPREFESPKRSKSDNGSLMVEATTRYELSQEKVIDDSNDGLATPTGNPFSQSPRSNGEISACEADPPVPESQVSVFVTPKPFRGLGRTSVAPPSPESCPHRAAHGQNETCPEPERPRRTSVDEMARITSVPGWELEFMDSQADSPQRPSPSHPSQAFAPDPRWKYRHYEAKLKARLDNYRKSTLDQIDEGKTNEKETDQETSQEELVGHDENSASHPVCTPDRQT